MTFASRLIFRAPVFRPKYVFRILRDCLLSLVHSLSLRVEVADTLDQKIDRLVPLLKTRAGPSIIYVTLQKHTEEVANHLIPHGIDAMIYHAGMPNEQRTKVQANFMASSDGVVICTIAFGMGIDKGTYIL
jgi:superfamily II DNA helicase RecQ